MAAVSELSQHQVNFNKQLKALKPRIVGLLEALPAGDLRALLEKALELHKLLLHLDPEFLVERVEDLLQNGANAASVGWALDLDRRSSEAVCLACLYSGKILIRVLDEVCIDVETLKLPAKQVTALRQQLNTIKGLLERGTKELQRFRNCSQDALQTLQALTKDDEFPAAHRALVQALLANFSIPKLLDLAITRSYRSNFGPLLLFSSEATRACTAYYANGRLQAALAGSGMLLPALQAVVQQSTAAMSQIRQFLELRGVDKVAPGLYDCLAVCTAVHTALLGTGPANMSLESIYNAGNTARAEAIEAEVQGVKQTMQAEVQGVKQQVETIMKLLADKGLGVSAAGTCSVGELTCRKINTRAASPQSGAPASPRCSSRDLSAVMRPSNTRESSRSVPEDSKDNKTKTRSTDAPVRAQRPIMPNTSATVAATSKNSAAMAMRKTGAGMSGDFSTPKSKATTGRPTTLPERPASSNPGTSQRAAPKLRRPFVN